MPLVTVDHLHAETSDGSVVPERLKIAEILADLDQRRGWGFWPTSTFIDEAGQAALLDQNHWHADSEGAVGESLAAAVSRSQRTRTWT